MVRTSGKDQSFSLDKHCNRATYPLSRRGFCQFYELYVLSGSPLFRQEYRNIPKFEDRRGRNYLQNPIQLGIYTLKLSSYVSNTARGGSVGLGLIRLSSVASSQKQLLLLGKLKQSSGHMHQLVSSIIYIYIYMIVQLRLCSHVYDRRREETQLA